MAAFYTHNIYQGEDYVLEFEFQDSGGNAKVLTGYTFTAAIKADIDDTNPVVSFTVDATDLATGKVVLTLAKTDTASLVGGVWDLRQVDASGDVSYPVAGDIVVQKRVTSS